MTQVKKKDGSLQEFSYQKVYQSVVNAGLEEKETRNIADQIQAWVQQSERPITTAEIRKRVIGLLETNNLKVAEAYKSYEKENAEMTN